jgi:hypothetical protein
VLEGQSACAVAFFAANDILCQIGRNAAFAAKVKDI